MINKPTNPTPFVRAEDAQWKVFADGTTALPARVYLVAGRTPHVVIPRAKRKAAKLQDGRVRIVFGEDPRSGFGGIMLDEQGRYAGSIRKRLEKPVAMGVAS